MFRGEDDAWREKKIANKKQMNAKEEGKGDKL